jgi:hypothetical protein
MLENTSSNTARPSLRGRRSGKADRTLHPHLLDPACSFGEPGDGVDAARGAGLQRRKLTERPEPIGEYTISHL